MENNNLYKEERFDSFLNKTIILSSKCYFKKQMRVINKERAIVDDQKFSAFLQEFIVLNNVFSNVENRVQLNSALESLSAIEQSVIFLLFQEDLSLDDAAKILEICSKSVSRTKLRAIGKLKKYFKGDQDYEK